MSVSGSDCSSRRTSTFFQSLDNFHTASCCLSARFSSANSRRVRTAEPNVRRRIPNHLTMTGQMADYFAQRKIVATDEFLEGTSGQEDLFSDAASVRPSVYLNSTPTG